LSVVTLGLVMQKLVHPYQRPCRQGHAQFEIADAKPAGVNSNLDVTRRP
jgi:hypothetical protein